MHFTALGGRFCLVVFFTIFHFCANKAMGDVSVFSGSGVFGTTRGITSWQGVFFDKSFSEKNLHFLGRGFFKKNFFHYTSEYPDTLGQEIYVSETVTSFEVGLEKIITPRFKLSAYAGAAWRAWSLLPFDYSFRDHAPGTSFLFSLETQYFLLENHGFSAGFSSLPSYHDYFLYLKSVYRWRGGVVGVSTTLDRGDCYDMLRVGVYGSGYEWSSSWFGRLWLGGAFGVGMDVRHPGNHPLLPYVEAYITYQLY